MFTEVAKMYGKNHFYVHELMKEENKYEMCGRCVLSPQVARVDSIVFGG